MSGSNSRAILLRLSVQDADVVRRELVAMGDQGSTALAKLDAAAAKTSGTAGGGGGMRGFGQAVGQAGFQVQDFATQVAMGQNALTAFGAQASQFLGIFGTGGAVAGAILTVGVLVAQLLNLGSATDDAAEAQKRMQADMERTNKFWERFNELVSISNGLLMTNAEAGIARSRRDRAGLVGEASTQLETLRRQAEAQQRQIDAGEAGVAFGRGQIARQAGIPGAAGDPTLERGIEAQQAQLLAMRENLAFLQARIAEAEQTFRNLERAPLQIYEGGAGPDAPERARTGGGGGRVAAGDPGALLARLRDQAAAREARGREQYESIIGSVNPQSNALRQYEDRQQTLTRLVEQGTITEGEFTDAVERTTVALGRQLETIEERGTRSQDVTRELGLTFTSAFEDAIFKGKELSDVLQAIEQDIARIIIRQTITAPLASAISPLAKSATDGIGSYLGGLISGARADGGPVMAGRTYLVGERGPELFTPDASGGISPNGSFGGVSFSPRISVDARGSDATVLARARQEALAISHGVVAQFVDQINRGGRAALAVGRR